MDLQSPDGTTQSRRSDDGKASRHDDDGKASRDGSAPGTDGPSRVGTPVTKEKPLGSRAPRFVKSYRALHLGWQVGVFLVGLVVVVVGVIMLPLPGPGWLVIFAGMAIWGTEFVWAQLVLRWTKRKVAYFAQRALDPRVRRRNIILTSVALVICGVLLSVYLWKFGFVMPWSIDD